ncbi:hypothetical protein D3C81_1326290 [compost metagenome]
MDAKVEQLEDDDGQREAVLRHFRARRHALALEFRRQVVGRELLGRKTLGMALDAEAVAIEHGDVQRIAVKAQIHGFQIDHVMLLLVQRIDDGGQVGGQGQLGPETRGQAGRARLPLLHDLFQLGRLRHVQQGHDEAGKTALAVEHRRLRPGDLHVALAVFQLVGQLGRQFQHRFELAPVGGPVQVRVVQLGNLRGRARQQIHAARAAALDEFAQDQATDFIEPDFSARTQARCHALLPAHARKASNRVLSSPVIWCVRVSARVDASASLPSSMLSTVRR